MAIKKLEAVYHPIFTQGKKLSLLRFMLNYRPPMIFFFQKSTLQLLGIVLFILPGLLWPAALSAQIPTPLVSEHQQEFRFNAGARHSNDLAINELLQILADGSGKLRVFAGYDLSCVVSIGFQAIESNGLNIGLQVDQMKISGDTHYRQFPLTAYLTPSFLDILLQVRYANGSVIKEIRIENIDWPEKQLDDIIYSASLANGRNRDSIVVEAKHIFFHYGENHLEKTGKLREAFGTYYHSDQKLTEIKDIINALSANDFESAILDEFRLCEAEVLVSGINYSSFHRVLPLNLSDPMDILPRLSTVNSQLQELRQGFNFTISHLDSLLYTRGIELLESGDTLRARDVFERSLVYNPLHMPSHIQLGLININQHKPVNAIERFAKLLSRINPPSIWSEITAEFIDYLFESETGRADKAIQDGRFLDALKILLEVEGLCNTIGFWDCPDELHQKISEVHYGMYRSYLSVARRAYASANNAFAITYIESALDYKQKNDTYVTDDSEATILLQQVLDAWYVIAENALLKHDFFAAKNALNSAGQLCTKYPALICRADAHELASAAQKMEQSAQTIALPVRISEPTTIQPTMTAEQALEKVRDLLSKGHLKVWAGETVEAQEFLNEILPVALRYNLFSDSLINIRIINLTTMIEEKDCEMALKDLHAMLDATHDNFRRGYFLEARTSLDKVKILHHQNTKCYWNLTDSIEKMMYINTAANYQDLLNESQRAYFKAGQLGFDDFIDKYTKADKYFHGNQLQQYGIRHQNLYEFANTSSNTSLVEAVVEFLSNEGEIEEAFLLLKLLQQAGFDPRQLRSLLEHAGSKAAIYTHASQPDIRPSVYIREKTENDSWFRYYTRSFTRNWPD